MKFFFLFEHRMIINETVFLTIYDAFLIKNNCMEWHSFCFVTKMSSLYLQQSQKNTFFEKTWFINKKMLPL